MSYLTHDVGDGVDEDVRALDSLLHQTSQTLLALNRVGKCVAFYRSNQVAMKEMSLIPKILERASNKHFKVMYPQKSKCITYSSIRNPLSISKEHFTSMLYEHRF